MLKFTKKIMILFVVVSLLLIPFRLPALAQDGFASEETDPHMRMVGDILLVRPLGIVGTVVGSALFVLSLPFSAAGGNIEEVYQTMVVEPAKHTFKRPLGQF